MLALCTLTVWNNKYNSDWVGIETKIGQINETMSATLDRHRRLLLS